MASSRSRIACLLAAAALAVPSAAWGQGAGDDQYQDPFGDEDGQAQDEGDGDSGSSGGGDSGSSDSDTSGESAPDAAASPPAAPAAAPEGGRRLPYTGADAGLLALGGTSLLATGLALRRRLR